MGYAKYEFYESGAVKTIEVRSIWSIPKFHMDYHSNDKEPILKR